MWDPPASVVEAANSTRFARDHGLASHAELLRRSLEDPTWFWDAWARYLPLAFDEPYDVVLDESRGPEWARWFTGGRLNLVESCVHRHARGERAGRVAIVAETEAGAVARRTYAELSADVARAADGLAALGVQEGDRVALVMPMSCELVTAYYAIAHLGAVSVPIFSGFSASAIASRLVDAEVVCVVTADGSERRGRFVPVKATVDEAVAAAPSVRHVVVHRHAGADVPWREGRDVAWADLRRGRRPRTAARLGRVRAPADGRLHVGHDRPAEGRRPRRTPGSWPRSRRRSGSTPTCARATPCTGPPTWAGSWAPGRPSARTPRARRSCSTTARRTSRTPAGCGASRPTHRLAFCGVSPTLIRALQGHGAEHARAADLSAPARLRLHRRAVEPRARTAGCSRRSARGGGRSSTSAAARRSARSCVGCDVTMRLDACSLGGPGAGHGRRGLGRRRDGRCDGSVGELVCTRTLAVDDARHLERPRPLPRDLLVALARRLGARRLGLRRAGRRSGSCTAAPTTRSTSPASASGRRSTSPRWSAHPAVVEACAVGIPHDVKGETAWCYVLLAPGYEPSDELRAELARAVEDGLGKAFRPGRIAFARALPRTRSAKIVRRAVRAVALGEDPGDLSTLEDPAALEAVRAAT